MKRSKHKKLSKKQIHIRIAIVVVVAAAVVALLTARVVFTPRADIKTQVEYTRALLDAMAGQDVENAQNEIAAKHESLRMNENYAEQIYSSDDDADDSTGETDDDDTEETSEDIAEEDKP